LPQQSSLQTEREKFLEVQARAAFETDKKEWELAQKEVVIRLKQRELAVEQAERQLEREKTGLEHVPNMFR
jgi:hypothetical protein